MDQGNMADLEKREEAKRESKKACAERLKEEFRSRPILTTCAVIAAVGAVATAGLAAAIVALLIL